jgi:hypothetical protein
VAGYQRRELQILGGSFNLNPPGDKVPARDYLLAQNWRVDRDGKLVSRYGYPLKFSIPSPGVAHSAGVFGGMERPWYVGDSQGRVYYNFGSTPIASGLDGNRVSFVALNGWMWIMNRAKQGKHNAQYGYQPWGLQAPTTAPVAPASGDAGSDGCIESNPSPVSNAVALDQQNVRRLPLAGVE